MAQSIEIGFKCTGAEFSVSLKRFEDLLSRGGVAVDHGGNGREKWVEE